MLENIKLSDLKQGWNNIEFHHGEYDRRFRLFVPHNYNQENPVAHLLIHGWNDHCDAFCSNKDDTPYRKSQSSQMDEIMDHEGDGHIIICPCSLDKGGTLGRRGWNAGVCCQTLEVDDADFVLESVKRTAKMIDPKYNAATDSLPFTEVHSSGFSNGGMLSTLLACQYPDLFDSIHLMNGESALASGYAGHELCQKLYNSRWQEIQDKTASPLRAAKMHGKSAHDIFKFSIMRKNSRFDMAFPWVGNDILGFLPIREDDKFFRELVGCDDTPLAPKHERKSPLYQIMPAHWSNEFTGCSDKDSSSGLLFSQLYHKMGKHHWVHQSLFPWSEGYSKTEDLKGKYGYDDSRAILEFIRELRIKNQTKKQNTEQAVEFANQNDGGSDDAVAEVDNLDFQEESIIVAAIQQTSDLVDDPSGQEFINYMNSEQVFDIDRASVSIRV